MTSVESDFAVEFVDELPAAKGARGKQVRLKILAARLEANPGQWAKWPWETKNPDAQASRIRKGESKSFPHTGFEATVREETLYVRARPLNPAFEQAAH